jgi:hypothetical protein
MAKRKKGVRRRRVSGTMNPKSGVIQAAAVAAGFFAGDMINSAIDKVVPASLATATGITGYAVAGAEAGIGAYLLFSKGKASIVKTAAGGVLLGAGLRRGLKKAGILSGYGSVPVVGGYKGIPVVGGVPAALAGNPEALTGYNVPGVGGYNRSNGLGRIYSDGDM